MEIFLGFGILAFLAAVIVIVLLGPGGDGLRRDPGFTDGFASSWLIGSFLPQPNHTVHSGRTAQGLSARADHIAPSNDWSDGLAASVDSRAELDPVEFHHTNNSTLWLHQW